MSEELKAFIDSHVCIDNYGNEICAHADKARSELSKLMSEPYNVGYMDGVRSGWATAVCEAFVSRYDCCSINWEDARRTYFDNFGEWPPC